MDVLKYIISVLIDIQGLIGIVIGVLITMYISKKERRQKDTITESERIDRYRLSAIKERLEAHQKAFEIWYRFSLQIHSKKNIELSNEARDFWVKNCLYLTPKCRAVFDEFIFLFSFYETQREMWKESDPENKKDRKDELVSSFNKIMLVGRVIQEEVDNSYTEPTPIKELKVKENKTIDNLK